ncbi:MAG TPA: beta-ketoacyl-[acyl-carrier-protein] synthase family protein [Flavihumibacter sp.]|nr:beta-ketoacyl-[acyl-carrier-protein] synthase family protein [Flavihumibacter sp.]
MASNVHIAGTGVVSAIGMNLAENLLSLAAGRTGIGPIRQLQTVHQTDFPSGEIPLSNAELQQRCGWEDKRPQSRTALLGKLAAMEALSTLPLQRNGRESGGGKPGFRSAFISATSVAGMDLTEDFFPPFLQQASAGRLQQVVNHECGAITHAIAGSLGVNWDYCTTISTACSSAANAIMLGARLIKAGKMDMVLAGGTDALSRFTLNGFNTLMILDHQLCQPFDQQRRGLNLGEGAGYLLLVNDAVKERFGLTSQVRVTGYANANDAHHQTASSPDGAGSFLAMQGALAVSQLQPADIQYINLHGTGTQNNDASESAAIRRLFTNGLPRLSTTKGFTGHTLAACGAIEAAYSVASLERQCLYPGLRITQPVIEEPGVMVNSFEEGVALKNILSNSFGFGGNCSSLIFSLS